MANAKKKRIHDDATIIPADFLQPIFGGDTAAAAGSPNRDGHLHDGGGEWGHVQKINLTQHTTDRLVLGDAYGVSKNITAYPSVLGTKADFPLINPTSIIATPYPFTLSSILATSIWYFNIPRDIDRAKSVYFSFNWMGDILASDGYENVILDQNKITPQGQTIAQTTTFRVTWQWYSPGYAIFPPAVIYDGYTPVNIQGTNINQNGLTRGRVSTLTANALPFFMMTNDSATDNVNYIKLTGLDFTQDATIIGIQVDILSSGFISATSGHVRIYNGNLIYLSKVIGSAEISFNSYNS